MENCKKKKIDVIILATRKNLETLRVSVPYCKKNIECDKIYVIANKNIEVEISEIKDVIFIDEDSVCDGLNIKTVENIIESLTGKRSRAGWYLQQFIKLGWSYKCTNNEYIVIDADTIPLNSLNFVDKEGKYLFTRKIEYNKPYFETIRKLFNGKVKKEVNYSFIAEHMIFNCECVKEMISIIMSNKELAGNTFYEKILKAIPIDSILLSGFSEFETYGNYMNKYHSESMCIRVLRTQREAASLLGLNPTKEQLIWASKDYDIISIEASNSNKKMFGEITKLRIVRALFKMKTLARIYSKFRTLYHWLANDVDYLVEND